MIDTLFNDLSVFDDGDGVGVNDGRESMSDDDTGATFAGSIECLLHYLKQTLSHLEDFLE